MIHYTLWQIIGIWLAGGAPMWILAWLVYPALRQGLAAMDGGVLWVKLALVGLVWQFVLSMLILYRDEGNIRISTICRRFWLNNPVSPRTGRKDNRLWWLLIPLMLLVAASELGLAPFLDGIWTRLFPFLAEPLSRSLDVLFAPEMHSRWIGAWGFFALFVISSVFNNFLSEEFLFRERAVAQDERLFWEMGLGCERRALRTVSPPYAVGHTGQYRVRMVDGIRCKALPQQLVPHHPP